MDVSVGARKVIDRFELEPHPEGGWYRQTFLDPGPDDTVHSTAIYFLLARGERSHWHRVIHAAEVWHHYAGDPLLLRLAPGDGLHGGSAETTEADGFDRGGAAGTGDVAGHVLGVDLAAHQQPQVIVPAGWWQSAEPLGDWTLAGCTVAPGFDFAQFELAPPDWSPDG